MKYVNQIMREIRLLEKSPPCDFLFSVFVRLTSGSSSTALAMFAIIFVCRFIVIRTVYNYSHQSNRYLHYLTTSLSRNVYGTDIATSKLWLATFLLQQGDYYKSLQNVNDVLSSIPPYALYCSGDIRSGEDSKQIYVDRYRGRNTDVLFRANEAWLFDMNITHSEYSFMPRAIQIEIDHCDPTCGVLTSPFTYTYYLMFLCYHRLGQYDNRDRTLRLLIDTVNDRKRCGLRRYHSYNIVGHCMLMAGYVEMARDMFLKSVRFIHTPSISCVLDKYNAAYKYLSLMWSN